MITPVVDLSVELGDARDQGLRSTCLLFALSAMNRHENTTGQPMCIEHLARTVAKNGHPWRNGIAVPHGAGALMQAGQTEESAYPYAPNELDRPLQPPPATSLDRIASQIVELPNTLDSIRDALNDDAVCGVGIRATTSQFQPFEDGIIRPDENEAQLGLHAVVAVGWGTDQATSQEYFLIRNSWGTEWGIDGHGWFPSDYLETIQINCFRAHDGYII